MPEISEYRNIIILVVIIAIVGVAYFVFIDNPAIHTYMVTLECDDTNRFNLTIVDGAGNVKFTGEVIQPFMILLDEGDYYMETWYYDGATRLGWQTYTRIDADRVIKVKV